MCDQRVQGFFDTEPNTKELSMFYDMLNSTIEQTIERIISSDVPCNTEQVMTALAEVQALDSNLIHHMPINELAAYGLRPTEKSTPVMPNDNQPEPMHNTTIQDLKLSVHVHNCSGAYGTLLAS